jgi:hypothetical protein
MKAIHISQNLYSLRKLSLTSLHFLFNTELVQSLNSLYLSTEFIQRCIGLLIVSKEMIEIQLMIEIPCIWIQWLKLYLLCCFGFWCCCTLFFLDSVHLSCCVLRICALVLRILWFVPSCLKLFPCFFIWSFVTWGNLAFLVLVTFFHLNKISHFKKNKLCNLNNKLSAPRLHCQITKIQKHK